MMKSGLGKIFLKFLHALTVSFLLLNFDQEYKFSIQLLKGRLSYQCQLIPEHLVLKLQIP